jgi:1,4-alpha-glucan branching enzyme
MARWVADLTRLYRSDPALFERDCDPSGFQWVDASDSEQSVISYLRRGRQPHDERLIILNFTPVPRFNYAIGVPRDGHWTELLNSDAGIYGGSGQGNLGGVLSTPLPWHGFPHRLTLTLPPLGALVLKGPQKATLSRPE